MIHFIDNFFSSFGQAVWEPLGGIFWCAFACIILFMRRKINHIEFWCLLAGAVCFTLWRAWMHVTGGRYHSYYIFIVLFGISYVLLHGEWSRRLVRIFFVLLLCMCFARLLWLNPYDRKVLSFYEMVHKDAKKFHHPIAISFTKNSRREEYYSKIPLLNHDRPTPYSQLFSGLKNNFSLFYPNHDAVYCFFEVRTKDILNQQEIIDLAPKGAITILGETFLDRHKKKKVVVFRCQPTPEPEAADDGELIPNGDFSQFLAHEQQEKQRAYLGRLAPRFRNEDTKFPAQWIFYQSLSHKSHSWATVVTNKNGNALRLEADGYLAAITPRLPVDREVLLSFVINVKQTGSLQFSREIQKKSGKGELYPILAIPMKKGSMQRFVLHLPPRTEAQWCAVWFWLKKGVIEISDVRIK